MLARLAISIDGAEHQIQATVWDAYKNRSKKFSQSLKRDQEQMAMSEKVNAFRLGKISQSLK